MTIPVISDRSNPDKNYIKNVKTSLSSKNVIEVGEFTWYFADKNGNAIDVHDVKARAGVVNMVEQVRTFPDPMSTLEKPLPPIDTWNELDVKVMNINGETINEDLINQKLSTDTASVLPKEK